MTAKGTKSVNFKPVGIFSWCQNRNQVVDYSITEAHKVFTMCGFRVFVPQNPDTGGDGDFIIQQGMKTGIVSCKSTTQFTRSKNPRPEINIRTNSKSKNNYGKVCTPEEYDLMIGIASNGTFCIWHKDNLKDVKSTVSFGTKGGLVGQLNDCHNLSTIYSKIMP